MYKCNCDICNNNNYKVLGDVKNNNLVKCNVCGHIYLNNRFSEEELKSIYIEDYFKDKYVNENEKVTYDYLQDKPNIMKFVEKRFKTIEKYKRNGTILDIGCAMGFYLEYAQKHGWEVFGVEASDYAANYAKELLGTDNIINNSIDKVKFENEKLDVVTMWLVLEHINNPVELLSKIRTWLKKDGILAVKVPNADGVTFRSNLPKWLEQHPEDHVCDYTPDTLERIMKKCGFELLEMETEGIYLDRITKDDKYLKDESKNKFFNYICKKTNLGDSLVAFFKKA